MSTHQKERDHPSTGPVFAVIDPATGELVDAYETATDDQIQASVATAHRGYAEWSTKSPEERAAALDRVADLHEQHSTELGELAHREMGKPLDQAIGEVEFCAAIYRFYAENSPRLLADEPIALPPGEGAAVIQRKPLGVLLGIMPWNYPFYQVARFAAPNLALGNAVMLKHAPQCPASAAALEQLFADAGVPEGCYVNLYADHHQVGSVIADQRVRGVSFTGSERAGAEVAALAGRNLKKVVLELGGSDPFIVLSTDDLDATVDAAVEARFENTGQACNAAKRFIVASDLYDEFVTAFTTKALALADGLAPLSSEAVALRLDDQVRRAVDDGATLVSGGRRDGAYFPPTVLTDLPPDSRAAEEELFGPVATIYRASSESEAVDLANATPYGLGSYVFSTDLEQATRVANAIDAGMSFINGVGLEGAELPFGGVKRSGFGRELGSLGLDEFVNKKLLRTAPPAEPSTDTTFEEHS